ncbi:MAG: hypothetical protein AAF798_19700 [Bacteroidota bacterium]
MTEYSQLAPSTRVWIYQANKEFPAAEALKIKQLIQQFVVNWVSHNNALKAYGDLLENRFVVLMVDESQAGASGCSIDKSVAFLKALQAEYGVDLFDRMTFTYELNGRVEAAPRMKFAELYANGTLTDETPVFDTLVKTKAEFEQAWCKPLGESWHKRMV